MQQSALRKRVVKTRPERVQAFFCSTLERHISTRSVHFVEVVLSASCMFWPSSMHETRRQSRVSILVCACSITDGLCNGGTMVPRAYPTPVPTTGPEDHVCDTGDCVNMFVGNHYVCRGFADSCDCGQADTCECQVWHESWIPCPCPNPQCWFRCNHLFCDTIDFDRCMSEDDSLDAAPLGVELSDKASRSRFRLRSARMAKRLRPRA